MTVTNTSGGVLEIIVDGGSSLTQLNKCLAVLAPGTTYSVAVIFVPVAYGTFTRLSFIIEASGVMDRVPLPPKAGLLVN